MLKMLLVPTWQAKIEGRLRLATEQAKLNTASRWERVSLNGWQ